MPEQSNSIMGEVRHIEIKVAGAPVALTTIDALLSAEVETSLYLPGMFILKFHDADLEILEKGPFALGTVIEIAFDTANEQMVPAFKGEITAIEPEFSRGFLMTLTIRGYDKSHRLNRATNTRSYLNTPDSDLVSSMAGEAGLSTNVTATSIVHEHIFQDNQTNLAFLHERARINNYEMYVDESETLHFKPPTTATGPTLAWGEQLLEFTPRASLAQQVDKVQVKGWDPATQQAILGQATTSSVQPEVGLGGSGGSQAKKVFSDATLVEMRQPIADQAEADKLAQALLDNINARFVQAEGLAIGNPNIKIAQKLVLQNLGDKFSGKYRVTTVRHIYTDTYFTEFRVEGIRPDTIADLTAATGQQEVSRRWWGVAPAIVTNNSDEDNLGRVKVKYTWATDDHESFWARLAGPGAGQERGLFWVPEVNDEVLIAFGHGNFNQPYVIGSLWSTKYKPPESAAVVDGQVEIRTIKTRAGHIIRLTDKSGEEKIEIIDCKDETKIIMDTVNKGITIVGSQTIKIDGEGSTVDIHGGGNISIDGDAAINVTASGDLKLEGMNVNITATSAVKISGNSQAELSSSGTTNVKGSLVNIN